MAETNTDIAIAKAKIKTTQAIVEVILVRANLYTLFASTGYLVGGATGVASGLVAASGLILLIEMFSK